MLENPTVYIDTDDSIENLPNNVNVVYRTHSIEFDEDGNPVSHDSYSDDAGEFQDDFTEMLEQSNNELRPPSIIASSIVSTPHELFDGSIVADLTFSVGDVPGAVDYEVRYTQ